MHGLLAGIARTPELAIDKSEADTLAKSIANVSRHYDVSMQAKTLDWINLMMACGMVYGPRIMVIGANRRASRATQAPRNAAPTGPAPGETPGSVADGAAVVIPGVGAVVRPRDIN